eukprot:23275-Prorocentrum_minimum.AAC.2
MPHLRVPQNALSFCTIPSSTSSSPSKSVLNSTRYLPHVEHKVDSDLRAIRCQHTWPQKCEVSLSHLGGRPCLRGRWAVASPHPHGTTPAATPLDVCLVRFDGCRALALQCAKCSQHERHHFLGKLPSPPGAPSDTPRSALARDFPVRHGDVGLGCVSDNTPHASTSQQRNSSSRAQRSTWKVVGSTWLTNRPRTDAVVAGTLKFWGSDPRP